MIPKQKSFRQVMEEGCVVAPPCVYDCASARAVEMSGFPPAMLLSSGELSEAMKEFRI